VKSVSVIIPAYNAAQHLPEAIESVLQQSAGVLEIIVADDGSADGTRDVAAAYPVRLLALARGGVSVARNAAVDAANGEWLAFLDADDIWLPGKIGVQLAAAEDQPAVDLILCERVFQFDVPIPPWFTEERDGGSATLFQPSAWLLRKRTFQRVGGFEPGRALGEDMNWLLRAWQLGIQHHVVPETLVIRRIHECNASARQKSAREQVFDLLRESVAIKRRGRADR
jgi:glycosyltransferase involved in cell wall biosynthesis